MSQLSREIEATRDSYWERERQAARNTTVLLVEGDDDKAVIEEILRRRRATFPSQVSVVVAGSRKNVLAGARLFPRHAIHLLVDGDTWTDHDVHEQRQQQGQTPLHVTSGWCIENIFLAPAFLTGYATEIAERLEHERETWVRAPHPSLDVSSADRLARSLTDLLKGDAAEADLHIDSLADSFEDRVSEILALPVPEQWQHVHGKRVFDQIVAPMLVASRGARVSWRVALAGLIGRPPPLDVLLAQLLP